jgi:peptide chain release factor 1
MDLRPHIERFASRLAEVEGALSDPRAFGNPGRLQELSREHARLKELVQNGQTYLKALADLAANREILDAEPLDSELALLAREEIAHLERRVTLLRLAVQRGLLPPDPADSRNTIIEIRAGAGGRSRRCSPPTSTACTPATPRPGLEGGGSGFQPVRPRRVQGNHLSITGRMFTAA